MNNKKENKYSYKGLLAVVLIAAAVVLGVAGLSSVGKSTQTSFTAAISSFLGNTTSGNEAAKQEETEPATEVNGITFSEDQRYFADIEIAEYGLITVELDYATAPITVRNFVTLASEGFYDGLTFHRIMEGFMMQGGDPQGNGLGGSGKTIIGEFSANGHKNDLSHTRGAISMARSSANNSASSQFFIVHEDSTFLDGQYAAFGYVTEGMDVVDRVCAEAKPTDKNGTIPADAQPVMTSVKIRTESK